MRLIRDAAWLTRERAMAYNRVLAAVMGGVALLWVGLSHHGLDVTGKPLGTDFESFWIAARMAAAGHPAAVYVPALHAAAQRAAFPAAAVGYVAFFYPPVFLLACLPFATLPYLAALAAWLGLTGLAYWRAMRWLWPQAGLLTLAFPAVFVTAGGGQNALLTTALFGAGMALIDRRPMLAGIALGCLIYKPQFLPVLPLVLLAAGRWRVVAGMALAAAVLCLASLAVFGLATWQAFLAATPFAQLALTRGLMGFGRLQSLFAALRLFGAGVAVSAAAQAVLCLAVLACLIRLALRRPPGQALLAPCAVAMLLATPFVLDYDLLLLAPALAWALRRALADGFRPWEKSLLAAAFVLPLVARLLAQGAHLPLTPVLLAALFVAVLRRAEATAAL
jgi:hypothetical protein